MQTVKINKKDYPVKFGFSLVKNFALKLGYKTIEEFDKWAKKLENIDFQTLDEVSELILLGIKRGCQKQKIECDLEKDDITDLMGEDHETFFKLIEIFSASMSTGQTYTEQELKELATKKKK